MIESNYASSFEFDAPSTFTDIEVLMRRHQRNIKFSPDENSMRGYGMTEQNLKWFQTVHPSHFRESEYRRKMNHLTQNSKDNASPNGGIAIAESLDGVDKNTLPIKTKRRTVELSNNQKISEPCDHLTITRSYTLRSKRKLRKDVSCVENSRSGSSIIPNKTNVLDVSSSRSGFSSIPNKTDGSKNRNSHLKKDLKVLSAVSITPNYYY